MCFSIIGDSLLTVKRALEVKELARQQLRDQLDEVEKETRSKLQEIDIFNNQLKVTTSTAIVQINVKCHKEMISLITDYS